MRRQTTIALGEIKDALAIPALITAMKDRDASVRREAARAVIRINRYRLVVTEPEI